MWIPSAVILTIWLVLKFVLHKGGYVHILLLLGLSILVVQIVAYRKTRTMRPRPGGMVQFREQNSGLRVPTQGFTAALMSCTGFF